ncbi:hypothetical protein O181_018218 [Austropuccinia psidii MF-1]|uniref:Reverse transcriptase Ty1/copia-type domain-containing protein n=1 Tax=Austropuccinia psidii MF-1 TaxID=1389203 RepID=A0A9Q3C7I8_9BASI|nr:hypothetical protein [Austropuccinia psidii MF-1]
MRARFPPKRGNRLWRRLLTHRKINLTMTPAYPLPLEQMDVKCAFLNGRPNKDLYILRPDGYTKHQSSNYFLLKRSLYSLNQSPQCWHKELKNALTSIGLSTAQSDPCLYYSTNQDKPMWLFVHVDNLIFGGSWNNEFKTKINNIFEMEDLGKMKFSLGIRITQHSNYISLIQDKLINNILEKFNVINPLLTSSPLPGNCKSFRDFPAQDIIHPFSC